MSTVRSPCLSSASPTVLGLELDGPAEPLRDLAQHLHRGVDVDRLGDRQPRPDVDGRPGLDALDEQRGGRVEHPSLHH